MDNPGLMIFLKGIGLPFAVIWIGLSVMNKLSRHSDVTKQLQENAKPGDKKELNMRCRGYSRASVHRHWAALDRQALTFHRWFLQLDLAFPILYGFALAIPMLWNWEIIGEPFAPIWLLLPLFITILADWAENLIHLSQLQRYMEQGAAGLHSGWIKVASMATTVKLVLFVSTCLLLVGLTFWAACTGTGV
jgi:hypothetical protein